MKSNNTVSLPFKAVRYYKQTTKPIKPPCKTAAVYLANHVSKATKVQAEDEARESQRELGRARESQGEPGRGGLL